MNKKIVPALLLLLAFAPGFQALADVVVPATPFGTDLMGVVTVAQWTAKGGSALDYNTTQGGFPFITYEDGTTNHDSSSGKLIQFRSSIPLQAGKLYQFVLHMKADQFPQGQTINFKLESLAAGGLPYESSRTSTWNVSRAGEWEEVYIPVRPQYNKSWQVQISVNPITRFASTPSTIFIAPDIDVYDLPAGQEIGTLHGVNTATDKDGFESRTQLIDRLGNFYTKNEESTTWKHVFPRMIYRDSPENITDYPAMFQRYKNYGFTGIMNISDAAGSQAAIDVGLEHLAMSANLLVATPAGIDATLAKLDAIYQWAEDNHRHHNLVWYNFDNENERVGDYAYQETLRQHIDTGHQDLQTGKRRHPIYFLNGNVGVPRTYHNASRTILDFTGSYVGSDDRDVYADLNPEPTLLTEFVSQNQRAPVTVIELQTGIGKTFIPSLFYGIIQGGRAMCVWRDNGPTKAEDGTEIKKTPFENTSWAAAFRDDVSPKIDQMLPLIEQPHFTSWKAVTDQYPKVRIGTRELNGAGYLILANFVGEEVDTNVTVNLQGIEATEAVDMFTGAHIQDVVNGQFTFTLGHHNSGYRVIHLITPVTLLSAQAEQVKNKSVRIHFALNRKAQAQVEYGLTTSYGSWTVKETSFNYAEHLQPITGLLPGKTYHFRVHTWDEDGNEVISEDQIFTTASDFNLLLTLPAILGGVKKSGE